MRPTRRARQATAAASAALETQRRIDGVRRLLRGDVTAHRRGERGCERRPERWRQARPDYILVVVRRASRSKAGRAHDDDARGVDARKPGQTANTPPRM